MITNYSFVKKRIVSEDDMQYAYAVFFILKNNRFVNYHYLYSKQKEKKFNLFSIFESFESVDIRKKVDIKTITPQIILTIRLLSIFLSFIL